MAKTKRSFLLCPAQQLTLETGESNLILARVESISNGVANVRTDDGSHLRVVAHNQSKLYQ
jgi:hypothetical protein